MIRKAMTFELHLATRLRPPVQHSAHLECGKEHEMMPQGETFLTLFFTTVRHEGPETPVMTLIDLVPRPGALAKV